jgi:isoleucyl-tRNA synthetase
LIAIRNEVLKALETARQEKRIGGGLEARVRLQAAGETARLLEQYGDFLRYLYIVSQVTIEARPGVPSDGASAAPSTGDPDSAPDLSVVVERASGTKCARCWNYSERVGEDADFPMVCERCSAALKEWLVTSG